MERVEHALHGDSQLQDISLSLGPSVKQVSPFSTRNAHHA